MSLSLQVRPPLQTVVFTGDWHTSYQFAIVLWTLAWAARRQ